MLFLGTHDHTIDAKQRLAIPSEFREDIPPGERLIATLIEGPTLAIYTQTDFQKRSDELDRSERSPEEVLLFEKLTYPNAAKLEIDKQGRIRLPEKLLKKAGLEGVSEVVVLGMKDHMEVRERKAWEAESEELEKARPDLLTNFRRITRAPQQNA